MIDPGFHEKFQVIPAGYQMRVKKLGIPEAERAIQNIYNISGNNARLNQNTFDNSTNVVNINTDAIKLLADLRSELKRLDISSEKRKSAEEHLDEVELQIQSGKPKKSVVSTMLKALPHFESITAIVESLLAML